MNVIVARAVDYQQLPFQLSGEGDRRAFFIFFRVILRQAAIALLIDRIVITNIGDRRHGHRRLVKIGIAEDRVQAGRPSTAPAPDADARSVDERPLDDGPYGVGLIERIAYANLAVDGFAPRAAARRGRAAIVHAHHD